MEEDQVNEQSSQQCIPNYTSIELNIHKINTRLKDFNCMKTIDNQINNTSEISSNQTKLTR